VGGVAVSYPYRAIFPPLQGFLCGRFFAGVRIFAVSASRAVPFVVLLCACPPSLWGGSFSGAGVFWRAPPPSRMLVAPVRGAFGVPHTSEGGVFLPCPDGALFHPPFLGGCLFFVDCGVV